MQLLMYKWAFSPVRFLPLSLIWIFETPSLWSTTKGTHLSMLGLKIRKINSGLKVRLTVLKSKAFVSPCNHNSLSSLRPDNSLIRVTKTPNALKLGENKLVKRMTLSRSYLSMQLAKVNPCGSRDAECWSYWNTGLSIVTGVGVSEHLDFNVWDLVLKF